jgi:universal stress protein E
MKRFKNILYFANNAKKDCPALKRAVSLAESNQARLTLVDVIAEFNSTPELEQGLNKPIKQLLHDSYMEALTELIAPYQKTGQMFYTQVLHGTAFIEIIRTVQRNNFDLLIKAASKPAGLTEKLLGSTDLHLLRKCPCPVWIERPSIAQPYRRILAAVDPLRNQPDENSDQLVMQLATSLAQQEQASVSVIHAWRLVGESMLRSGRFHLSSSEVDRLLEQEKQRHAVAMDALLADFELPTTTTIWLEKGDAASLILQHSANADVIVMGTVGRTGIPGFIIGNTAENVLQNTQVSVLAVKPAGFSSPVK